MIRERARLYADRRRRIVNRSINRIGINRIGVIAPLAGRIRLRFEIADWADIHLDIFALIEREQKHFAEIGPKDERARCALHRPFFAPEIA